MNKRRRFAAEQQRVLQRELILPGKVTRVSASFVDSCRVLPSCSVSTLTLHKHNWIVCPSADCVIHITIKIRTLSLVVFVNDVCIHLKFSPLKH